MLRWLRRLLVAGTSVLLLCGGLQVAADAAVARVSGVHVRVANRCAGTLRVRWHGVSGATYQLRWATSKRRLGAARLLSVGRHAASVGPVPVGGTTFVQVRAVRRGHAGAWSKPGKAAFGTSRLGQPCDLSGHGLSNGVDFTWAGTPHAAHYRVRWSAAPYGKWPESARYVSGWLPATARSSVFGVSATPQTGDFMLGVAYANPVWGQLEAKSSTGTVRHSAGFVPVFPAAPDPGAGAPVRIGTYNVMAAPAGARAHAIAANIRDHGLGIVALQEAAASTADAVRQELGGDWTYVTYQNTSQQIMYRTGLFTYDNAKGTIDVHNYATGGTINTPWARLKPVGSTKSFYVVSAHFQENPNSGALDKKHQNGLDAQTVMAKINEVNTGGRPVIVAGDLHYLREPFGDVPGYVEAQPTFVRGGYYDAMAAVTKVNVNFGTFNSQQHQDPAQTGVSPRSDYIMLKGFRSSAAYVNVANWSYGGLIPSDHNLVYANVVVP